MYGFTFLAPRVLLASFGALAAATIVSAQAFAQSTQAPLFYDGRRLPDMEVERRNQEVLIEQQRLQEERKLEAAANAKRRADDERRAASDIAEAQRKAEEDKRAAAEVDARQKAEDARLAASAEAQRKADEEKRIAAEADARKKSDDARLAAAAETQRKADEEKRATEVAAARKNAEEVRLAALASAAAAAAEAQRVAAEAATAATAAARKPAQSAAQTAALIAPPGATKATVDAPASGCAPASVKSTARSGGRIEVAIDSPCRKTQPVMVQYGGFDFVRKLNSNGQASIMLDLFAGDPETAKITFADATSHTIAAAAGDLHDISKIAIIWSQPVELALHASENGAPLTKSVWSGAASTAELAKAAVTETGRGAGFMSTVNAGITEGPRMEVYTFIHSPEQDVGAVAMSLDYVSRGATPAGDMCGQGALAEITFDVVILDHRGQVRRENGQVPAAKCGEPLSEKARFLREVVPDLRFRR